VVIEKQMKKEKQLKIEIERRKKRRKGEEGE